MYKEYDLEALNALPINEVLVAFGARYPKDREPGVQSYSIHCMGKGHKNSDKNPSLSIWKDKNICKCQSQGCVSGDPINVATKIKGNFKEACEWLHETFNVPYGNGQRPTVQPVTFIKKQQHIEKSISYMRFEPEKEFKEIDVNQFLPVYEKLTKEQRLKMLYTFIYKFSLNTDQTKKHQYYKSRGIETNHYVHQIGFLGPNDIKELNTLLIKHFPLNDLLKFKVFSPENKEKNYQARWKYFTKFGYTVIPFNDLYSNMATGFQLRKINKMEKGKKEYQISYNDIVLALPFALSAPLLRKKYAPIYLCEGHVDGLSTGKPFIGIPGVDGYKEMWLGLLKGHHIKIVFDQDIAAPKSIYGEYDISYVENIDGCMVTRYDKFTADKSGEDYLKSLNVLNVEINIDRRKGLIDKLHCAGVKNVDVIAWDEQLGEDINDLLINGNLAKVIC